MTRLRLIILCLVFAFVGASFAQEDLTWLTTLLPTGDDININKQVLQGSIEIAAGNQILNEGFSAVNAWDTIQDRDGFRRIRDERYEMLLRTSGAIYAGLSTSSYSDSIISVESIHLSQELNDGYGLVCRATGWENSYHFYISGDGYFNIAIYENGRGRGLTDWTSSELINQGADAVNSLTAVCVRDYLALYINGTLAAEVRDSTFSSGAVGMAVILFTEDSEVNIAFDNLRLWEATSNAPVLNPTPSPIEIARDTNERRANLEGILERGSSDLLVTNLLLNDSFDNPSLWTPIASDGGSLSLSAGLMNAVSAGANEFPTLAFRTDGYTNGVFEIQSNYVEGSANTVASVICRGDVGTNYRGYYFNLSADGFYSIWLSDGTAFRYIAEWQRDFAVNVEGENLMTVVCVDDYFAYYLNGSLLHEFNDDSYSDGRMGLAILGYEGAATMSFDNLFIWEAALD